MRPPREVDVAAGYRELVSGVPAQGAAPSYAFLVSSALFEEGRGDLFVAAGLASALVRRGAGARLVPASEWYEERPPGTVVVGMVADVDARRIPGRVVLLAWIRNRVRDWVNAPGFGLFDAVLASSEIAAREVRRHYGGPVETCPIGFDPALFYPTDAARDIAAVSTANHWGTERDVHRVLRELGPTVHWYGVDRSRDPGLGELNRGVLDFFQIPAVYRRAVVTIDDTLPNSVGWGTLNSRLFEALACGSLIATNTGVGLHDLGLEMVPVYRDADELTGIIERAVGGEYDDVLAECRSVVRTRHSFERRVVVFEEVVQRATTRASTRSIIDYYPDYTTNPYQALMYSALDGIAELAVPVADILDAPIARDLGGRLDERVLHLHWVNPVAQHSPSLDVAVRRVARFKATMLELKARGITLVWTVHNAMPHELHHYFLELEVCQFLAREADIVHVMSAATPDIVADLYEIPADKIVQIDHPAYDDVYPTTLDRASARLRLGLSDVQLSYMFLGAIRDYKGVPLLLDAFGSCAAADARLRLDVIGQVGGAVQRRLRDRLVDSPQTRMHLGRAADWQLQEYLCAADVMVFPYTRVLNSGSVLLALTYGVPIIIPALDALGELARKEFVETFVAEDPRSLAAAIERSTRTLVNDQARAAALAYAQSRSRQAISKDFRREVLDRTPRGDMGIAPSN